MIRGQRPPSAFVAEMQEQLFTPGLLQYLGQSTRVGWGGALLVVVEIDEHRAALASPFPDVTRPSA
jgi:hypothetical protein